MANSKEGRVLALSLLVNNFSFKQLCSFNPKDKQKSGTGEETNSSDFENNTNSESNEDDDEVNDSGDKKDNEEEEKNVTFNPPLQWYYYQTARLHYRSSQGALQPLICPPKNISKIPFDVLHTIIDFVTSEEVSKKSI